MWYNKKYDCYRPTDKERSGKMRKRKKENIIKSRYSKSENWFQKNYVKPFFEETWIKINRQSVWWTRIYDFWCCKKWIAIEIDWWYHETEKKKKKDIKYDRYNLEVSWIIVIRVKNFDEEWAKEAIERLKNSLPRKERRINLWITKIKKRREKINIENYDCKISIKKSELVDWKMFIYKLEKELNWEKSKVLMDRFTTSIIKNQRMWIECIDESWKDRHICIKLWACHFSKKRYTIRDVKILSDEWNLLYKWKITKEIFKRLNSWFIRIVHEDFELIT